MTARRFGGRYSDDGAPEPPTPPAPPAASGPPIRVGFWVRAMMYAPAPLLIAALGEMRRGAVGQLAIELSAFALLIFAAWLLREGVKAQIAYDRRRTARRPAVPRKILSSIVTGVGVALAAGFGWGLGPVAGIGYGLVAAALHAFAFGPDPLRDKGMEDVNLRDLDRAAEAVDKGEAVLRETLDAAARIADRRLRARIEALCGSAREVLRQIEDDPRDLRRARRFLSVYLVGARDATVRYARLDVEDPVLRRRFDTLLTQLETSFEHQRAKLLDDDRDALEIEIEVLRDRLAQEGLGR